MEVDIRTFCKNSQMAFLTIVIWLFVDSVRIFLYHYLCIKHHARAKSYTNTKKSPISIQCMRI